MNIIRKGKVVGMNMSMAQLAYAYYALYGTVIPSDAEGYRAATVAIWKDHGEAAILKALESYDVKVWLAGGYECQKIADANRKAAEAK